MMKTHVFVKSPCRLRPTCVPLCKARWKVPGVGTSARNGGAASENATRIVVNPHPQIMISKFHHTCYQVCGGVRVWFDFVWCQRISAEIKIEIHSTSFNLGKRQGCSLWQKKGLHILICVVHPQKVYYRVPGFTFWVGHSTIVHDRLCVPLPVGGVGSSRGTHPTHFPAALGFEVYPGTTGFNRLIGLIYSYNPLLNNYDWFQ